MLSTAFKSGIAMSFTLNVKGTFATVLLTFTDMTFEELFFKAFLMYARSCTISATIVLSPRSLTVVSTRLLLYLSSSI